MHISLRSAFLRTCLLPVLIVSCWCLPFRAQQRPFHVIVLGDWGREGRELQLPVRDQMIAVAKKQPVDMVITTGDNFYEDGVTTVTDSQWQTSFERIYSDTSLQIPWLVSLGNHDYIHLTSPDAEIAYTSISKRWNMPARYFQKDVTSSSGATISFFIIDTSPFIEAYQKRDTKYHVLSQHTDRQLHWLDSALGACKSKWKFVAGHHPIYSASGYDGDQPELIAALLPILKRHHVQAYLAGHNHDLQHFHKEGMDFYVSGGGSQAKDSLRSTDALFSAVEGGFLDLKISGTNTTATFISSSGREINESVLKP